MKKELFFEQNFDNSHSLTLVKAEYEACTFKGIDFKGQSLSSWIFTDCEFEDCNLSLCLLSQTSFKNVTFNRSKLLGLRWDDCNAFLFSAHFIHSVLDMSSFYAINLKKTSFASCSLKEADFTDSLVTDLIWDECDLTGAIFDGTNLSGSDFRTSHQYIIDPSKNNVKNAKFSWPAAAGLLTTFGVKIE